MPSSENLFTLDPLKTSLTKPITDVKVQGPANRSVENSQLLQGLQTFGNAVGSLAEVKKQEQLTTDMRLAQNAALRGEAEPSGLFGAASDEFERIVEANVITKTIRDMNQFLDGEGGSNLVNAGGAYSENIAAADKVFDTIYDQGKNFSLNPRMQDIFNQKVEEQRNKTKLEIALVNRDRNRSQVSQRILNMLEEAVDVSKDQFSGGVDTDASDIEGTDEYPILFSFEKTLSPEFLNTTADDVVSLNMGLDKLEARRLTMQMFLQNETVIAQPSLADKLMASEYSPGVTYEALFSKGLLASNTDKDATDIVKMRNIQIQASFNHQKALDDQDKADAITRTNLGKSFVIQSLDGGVSNAEAYQIGFDNGLRKDEITTLIKAQDNFEGNLTFGTNTPQGQAFKKEILAGKNLSEDAITVKMRELNLDPADAAYYKGLASLENKEILVAQKAFDSEIKIIEAKTFQILKSSLNNNKAITLDENGEIQFDMAALASQAIGGTQGLDPNEIQDVILRLQRLQNDYKYKSSEASKEVARSNTFDRAAVTQFGVDYNKDVAIFISDLQNNIISRSQVRDARKKEAKEEADKTAAKAAAEVATKEPVVLPTATVPEEIENKQQILTDPTTHITNEIDIITNAYKSLFSTDPKASPKSSEAAKEKSVIDRPISESEQVYLKRLEQAVPIAPPEESVSTTGLGSFVDNIDANFDALPGIINDMHREQVFLKGLNLFFEGAVSDFKESFSTGDQAAEVPAGGGSEEQLVGKGLSEPGPTPQELRDQDALMLGKWTGQVTSEGRKVYENNKGGVSSEYTIGVKDPKINNGELTDIPSIYNGKIVTEQEAIRIISENKGIDPETGRFITPGGDPEARSKSISIDRTVTEIADSFGTFKDNDVDPLGFIGGELGNDQAKINATEEVFNNFTPATAAKYGSLRYNASNEDEQTKWEVHAKDGIDAYNKGELTGEKKTNVDNLISALDKHKQSYINDLNNIGFSYDNFKQLMIGAYAGETTFGTLGLVSSKDVVGQLQVTRKTLTDMWKRPNTPFGPNVAKSLKSSTNKTLNQLKALPSAQLRTLLLNNDEFNFMAGAMIMINKLQSRKLKL